MGEQSTQIWIAVTPEEEEILRLLCSARGGGSYRCLFLKSVAMAHMAEHAASGEAVICPFGDGCSSLMANLIVGGLLIPAGEETEGERSRYC